MYLRLTSPTVPVAAHGARRRLLRQHEAARVAVQGRVESHSWRRYWTGWRTPDLGRRRTRLSARRADSWFDRISLEPDQRTASARPGAA